MASKSFEKPLNKEVSANTQAIANTQNGIGYRLSETNTTGSTLTVGTYVYLTGNSTLGDGMYQISTSVSVNGTLGSSNCAVVPDGVANALSGKLTSKAASSGGTDLSMVTTGEKYTWNNKLNASNVYNGLDKSASGYALDARQGKALNNKLTTETITVTADTTTTGGGYIKAYKSLGLIVLDFDIFVTTTGTGWKKIGTISTHPTHSMYGFLTTVTGAILKPILVESNGNIKMVNPDENEYIGSIVIV